MKFHSHVAMAAFVICGTAMACEPASEMSPLQIAGGELGSLLLHGKFDELERRAKADHDLSRRLSDGQPALAAFVALTESSGPPCGGEPISEDRVELFSRMRKQIDAWRKAKPQSSLARLEDAIFYLNLALGIRGQGVASRVPQGAWGDFRQNIRTAGTKLDALQGASRNDPMWYHARLRTALYAGMPEPQFRSLVEQALTRYPDYTEIAIYAAPYYAPKWYGSRESLVSFIDRAIPKLKGDGPDVLYARMWWSAMDDDMFMPGGADWKRFSDGFEQMTHAYPDRWNTNHYAAFACLAGQMEKLEALLATMGKPMMSAWFGLYEQCVEIAEHSHPPKLPGR